MPETQIAIPEQVPPPRHKRIGGFARRVHKLTRLNSELQAIITEQNVLIQQLSAELERHMRHERKNHIEAR